MIEILDKTISENPISHLKIRQIAEIVPHIFPE